MHKGGFINMQLFIITLFAESKLLQRLLSMGSKVDSNVYLFVRLEKANYACLGAVAINRYDVNASPVFIEWKIMEYEQLKEKDYFKEVVSIASAAVNN